ncbi:hypothetical protein TRFO_12575 [Tritrichomonas foetus]|uniref:Uncharacterized protein n=1 Tax=Tritrichomonas foetus TaxID=1144522 RepID=A0A1J4L1C0_9EUKA|nr:hypothetical protein TRFO_12575 [Tritrichomonas foetus]|eukprot:OHT17235.1 hypothetical protein TRFO_12575 [Tritrichomonas foetus]
MSECSNVATASKGATQYTHLFLCISSGRRLTNFSMRSLYFQINLHSSLNPLISHSVWCHRPDLHFNAAFSIALNKLLPLTINDLSISFDLYSRQLQSSSLLGVAKLELNQKETLQKARMPITYFYHQDPVDLIDTYTSTPVGNIFITVALGYSEQTNLVEPQTRFIMAQIVPVDKKNSKSESPSIWKKSAQKHGWLSIDEIKDNWRNIALKNGWKIPRNDFSFISFEPILIMPEYISPPTADLLNSPIEPSISVAHSSSVTSAPALFEENENNFSYDFVQPLEIASIFPQTPKPFHNAMKKPIIIMDFFPRFSYSNKYENSERTESEWDRLIGRYVKSNSSTTLKTFPKRKRPQSVGNSKRKEFFNFKNETTHNFQNKKKRDDENPRKVPFPPKIKSRNVKMHTYASSDLTTLIEDKYRIDFDESDNKDKNNEEMSINKNTNINNYQFSTKNTVKLPYFHLVCQIRICQI